MSSDNHPFETSFFLWAQGFNLAWNIILTSVFLFVFFSLLEKPCLFGENDGCRGENRNGCVKRYRYVGGIFIGKGSASADSTADLVSVFFFFFLACFQRQ